MSEVLTEITQLSELDCFHIVERHKTEFTYPLHRHREFELNFVEHGAGVRRIVGDSMETIGDYDLALIAAENLEHVWEDGNCKSPDIREITIQFSPGRWNPCEEPVRLHPEDAQGGRPRDFFSVVRNHEDISVSRYVVQ